MNFFLILKNDILIKQERKTIFNSKVAEGNKTDQIIDKYILAKKIKSMNTINIL